MSLLEVLHKAVEVEKITPRTLRRPIVISELAGDSLYQRSYATMDTLGEALGIYPRTIARWVNDPRCQMPHVRVATIGHKAPHVIGFDLGDIQKWLDTHQHILVGLKRKPIYPVNLLPE